jgi:nucleotide-binding universal stress UspA family protein
MGTQRVSGLQKILFESNVSAVINKSSLPVITVPECSIFKDLKLIVYASDMHKICIETQKIIPLAKLFDASINILHVLPPNSKKEPDKVSIEVDLIEKYNYPKISFHIAHNNNVVEGINEFIVEVKADMLAMYTHEIGFFDKFLKASFSREEAYDSLIPLLTLKK